MPWCRTALGISTVKEPDRGGRQTLVTQKGWGGIIFEDVDGRQLPNSKILGELRIRMLL